MELMHSYDRLDEIIARNQQGTESALQSPENKRSDTWLLLNGMVRKVSLCLFCKGNVKYLTDLHCMY